MKTPQMTKAAYGMLGLMKTCGQCKHRWMECCLKDMRERLTVDAADEACESFELHLGKLDEAFETSLEKAREKHPEFLDVWPKAEDDEHYETCAKYLKEEIAHKEVDQLRAVLYSEVNEFIAEIARGDFNAALAEAGDVVAVLYRALNGEGGAGGSGGSGGSGRAPGAWARR